MEDEPKVAIEPATVRKGSMLAGIGDDELRREVESADILIVPVEGHAGYPGPVFPEGTMEVFRAFNEQAPAGIRSYIRHSNLHPKPIKWSYTDTSHRIRSAGNSTVTVL